ncbi:hypothetical protein F5Y11DRAFT_236586 [Daldinia sp. FL1419]|nr:hypothetical protein F5Y11DRAFT_236586 [Daldinia sp. FL1419]
MRLLPFLTLAVSLCLATSEDVLDKRAAKCGIKGNRILNAYYSVQQANFAVPAQCGALCASKILCQSYAVDNGYCRLYLLPVVKIVTQNLPGSTVYYDKACATNTDICEATGSRLLTPAFSTANGIADNTFKGCSDICKKTSGCLSYSIELKAGGKCRLYKKALVKDFSPDPNGATIYWDVNCPRAAGNSGPTLVFGGGESSTVTIPASVSSVEEAVVFTPEPTPVPLTTDSPPYVPSGPQVTPDDDDEFIATYTYEQFELPTVVAEGSPPVTTGLAQPTALPSVPCMVEPGSKAQFTVLNENFVPIVSRASDSIGPLLQPTKAPAADDPMLHPETFTVPGFYLQAAEGASGVYDMVYAGSSTPQFVAMTNTGAIVLVGASTGTSFKNNRVTTIFNVDCFGRISITQGGSGYTWSTDGASSKLTKAATPANNMKALPQNIPAVETERKNRRRNKQLGERLMKRSYSDGPAPKCPSSPGGLVARTKQGYQRDQGNFCESLSEYWSISPFDFDGSCEIQSRCYDHCEDYGWQSCTGIFGTAMILSCLDAFDSWWEVIPAIACAAQASYFTGVAATSKGRDLFYKSQAAMCRCFCSSPPDTCVFNDGNFYCADIHGNDDANCGNCGRQCGPNSKCHGGKCGCPQDQCGSTCLDFRNNPNNCGGCGNVCNPSFCLDGRCYAPKPGECTPEQSVTNGDFTSWWPTFTNWTMAAYPGCALNDKIKFEGVNYLANGKSDSAISVEMSNLPSQGCEATMVQKQVKMCPGIKYDFTFAMGYVNQVGGSQVVSNADCTVRWLTGTPSSWTGVDGFQSSPSYSIGISNPNYKTFGPWSLHVSENEVGVTKVKKDLFVDLTAVIHCAGPTGGAGRFVIRDIKMSPVGQIQTRETIGEEPAYIMERASATTNITEKLAPYYPAQKKGEVIVVSFEKKVNEKRSLLEG